MSWFSDPYPRLVHTLKSPVPHRILKKNQTHGVGGLSQALDVIFRLRLSEAVEAGVGNLRNFCLNWRRKQKNSSLIPNPETAGNICLPTKGATARLV